jgi:hypothetical protein
VTPPAGGTTILGAGPTGLAAALGLAAREPVRIIAPTVPAATDAPRVDMVPATFLAFLLELGVHPAQLGVSDLHDRRIMAWGGAVPETVRGNAMAHVERPALELALLAAVTRLSRATIVAATAAEPLGPKERVVIDATGRRAVSATQTVGPPQPWIARVFSRRGQFDQDDQVFRMAALPAGYAYRMASPRLMTIGVVLSRALGTMTAAEIEAYVGAAGAGWLLAGCGRLDSLPSGRGGVASVQWSTGSAGTQLVGDALLARDSLSAQGLCTGISHAVAVARHPGDPRRDPPPLRRHLDMLARAIEASRFRAEPPWQQYLRFVRAGATAADWRVPHPLPAPGASPRRSAGARDLPGRSRSTQ